MQATISRDSSEARELARWTRGTTWLNEDALALAIRQMGAVRWARRIGGAWEARGVWAILERPVWISYVAGTDQPDGLTLAITVDRVNDLGRDEYVERGHGVVQPIDRYMISGTAYYLRDDDLRLGDLRDAPGGSVPFEQVLSLPRLVRVVGLHGKPNKGE